MAVSTKILKWPKRRRWQVGAMAQSLLTSNSTYQWLAYHPPTLVAGVLAVGKAAEDSAKAAPNAIGRFFAMCATQLKTRLHPHLLLHA